MLLNDINDFLLFCELTRQYSQTTIRNYSHTLRRLYDFLVENKIDTSEKIEPKIIDRYRLYLDSQISSRGEKLNNKTLAYQIIVLRSFLKYLLEQNRNVSPPEKFILPKTQSRQIEYLTNQEIKQILEVIDITQMSKDVHLNEIIKARNKAIIQTIAHSGLRISEVLNLPKSSLINEESRLIIRGKGGKVRSAFISNQSMDLILKYLEIRGQDDNPYLFVASTLQNHRPLTTRSAQQMVQKYALLAGINKKITPHVFRHSFATTALKKGADIRSVQVMLGHSNISTTQLYTHVTDTELEQTHSKIFNDVLLAAEQRGI